MKSVNSREVSRQFGPLLKFYRQRTRVPETGKWLTQEELAELLNLGVSGMLVGHWETGKRTIKHHDRLALQALVKVLHIYDGLQTLDEANEFLEAGLYSRLSPDEIREIDPAWLAAVAEQSNSLATPQPSNTVNPSRGAIYERLDIVFRWSEAGPHARSSWVGMFIWSLSAVTDRITPRNSFNFLSALILWIITSWLVVPLLQWPLDDPATRLQAAIMFAVSSITIPFIVALFSGSDVPANQLKETNRQKRTHFLLKLTGAAVGYNVVALILLFIALGVYHTGYSLSLWGWRIAVSPLLLMTYIGARRIPADRHKMYDGHLRLHPADPLFLTTFLLMGIGVGGFVYFGYDVLSNKAAGVSILITLAGIALWHRQRQSPVPDLLVILGVGTAAPFLILCLFFFIFPSQEAAQIVRSTSYVEMALVTVYFLSTTTLLATVQLRNTLALSLQGAIGLLSVLLILLASLLLNPLVGRIACLLVLALWILWGRKRFRAHFSVHTGIGFHIVAIGLSLYLIAHGSIPVWANLIGYTASSIALIIWAYQPDTAG